jgi:hypothetical protein
MMIALSNLVTTSSTLLRFRSACVSHDFQVDHQVRRLSRYGKWHLLLNESLQMREQR